MENDVDKMHLFMILKVHSVIHVHDFKCTFSNSVYTVTFKSCSMNRSTFLWKYSAKVKIGLYNVTISEINRSLLQILIMKKNTLTTINHL